MCCREVVADKGFHSNDPLSTSRAADSHLCLRAGPRTAPLAEKPEAKTRSTQSAPDPGSARHRLLRRRGELLERPFAHIYETGGMRRTHLRGHHNIFKRLLVHVGGFNLGLLMRTIIGVGTHEDSRADSSRYWQRYG